MMIDWKVPVLWPGETVFIIGGGASVDKNILPFLPKRGRVIAINSAFEDCLDAHLCFWNDQRWLRWNADKIKSFRGIKVCRHPDFGLKFPGIVINSLKRGNNLGLSTDRDTLNGLCSGASALNLAYLLGATRIILLGYDMQRGHYHDRHKVKSHDSCYDRYMRYFPAMAMGLKKAGVEVYNVSPISKLKAFPFRDLKDFL